ncbi:MAG: hypothetical protein R6X33_01050 [Candidatus Brocadiia bacterium]
MGEADGTMVAGERGTFRVRLMLTEPLEAGLSIEAWRHFVSDVEDVQCDSPDEAAHFSCRCSDGKVESYACRNAPVHGPGSYFPYRKFAGVRLPADAEPGEQFVFEFRDVRMQTYSDRPFNVRFVLLDGDELLGYFGDALFTIEGGPPDNLRVTAPTVVAVGEPFGLHVLFCDRWGNPAGHLPPPAEIELRPEGLAFDRLTADEPAAAVTLHNVALEKEGVHHVQVNHSGERLRGVSNPIVVESEPEQRIYWGDIHQHACYNDGRARPTESYQYGKRVARLDFGAVAPHIMRTFGPPAIHVDAPAQQGWRELREAAAAAADDRFVALLGYESGVRQLVGDMNVYFSDPRAEPPEKELNSRPESYGQFVEMLRDRPGDVLLLPHAHAGGGPGKFDLPKLPDIQTSVEICSVHGVFPEFYHQWLRHGHRVGVHGAGDNHMPAMGNANPGAHYVNTNGLTAAVAPSLSQEDVWAAFRDRRTYAATGNRRIYLDFSVGGTPMGGVAQPGRVSLSVVAAATRPVTRIDVVKNCEVVQTWRPPLEQRRTLRVLWMDTWPERRADDSETRGAIQCSDGGLRLREVLGIYNAVESIEQTDDGIRFDTRAYSETSRGALLDVSSPDPGASLMFRVEDSRRGRKMLEETFELPLGERGASAKCKLTADESDLRQEFSREIVIPEFRVTAEWVNPDGPLTAELHWEDQATDGDHYYVMIEQLDGNRAWSSPIWINK